jgi:8-oxo-dGTP pyrophosphatase MutT (NUDIX family)
LQDNDGTPIEDYIVAQPKTRTEQGVYAVSVLPVYNEKVGLLDVFRHPLKENSWEVPGGFIEPGETDRTSALRELREETGLICDPQNLHDLGIVSTSPSTIAAKIRLFAAIKCKPSTQDRVPELGHRRFKWFSKSEINAMIASSKIQEVSTLLTLYRAENSLQRS